MLNYRPTANVDKFSQFLLTDRFPSQALHLSIDAFTDTPPASDWKRLHRAFHGEVGFNGWKKIWVYSSVPVNSQPWTSRCGDRYTTLSRSSAAVSEWVTDSLGIFYKQCPITYTLTSDSSNVLLYTALWNLKIKKMLAIYTVSTVNLGLLICVCFAVLMKELFSCFGGNNS